MTTDLKPDGYYMEAPAPFTCEVSGTELSGRVTRSWRVVNGRPSIDYMFEVLCVVGGLHYTFAMYKPNLLWKTTYLYIRNEQGRVLSVDAFAYEDRREDLLFARSMGALAKYRNHSSEPGTEA